MLHFFAYNFVILESSIGHAHQDERTNLTIRRYTRCSNKNQFIIFYVFFLFGCSKISNVKLDTKRVIVPESINVGKKNCMILDYLLFNRINSSVILFFCLQKLNIRTTTANNFIDMIVLIHSFTALCFSIIVIIRRNMFIFWRYVPVCFTIVSVLFQVR